MEKTINPFEPTWPEEKEHGGEMERSKAEQKLAGTVRELEKAKAKLAKFERALVAPSENYEPATEIDIASVQKASLGQ